MSPTKPSRTAFYSLQWHEGAILSLHALQALELDLDSIQAPQVAAHSPGVLLLA